MAPRYHGGAERPWFGAQGSTALGKPRTVQRLTAAPDLHPILLTCPPREAVRPRPAPCSCAAVPFVHSCVPRRLLPKSSRPLPLCLHPTRVLRRAWWVQMTPSVRLCCCAASPGGVDSLWGTHAPRGHHPHRLASPLLRAMRCHPLCLAASWGAAPPCSRVDAHAKMIAKLLASDHSSKGNGEGQSSPWTCEGLIRDALGNTPDVSKGLRKCAGPKISFDRRDILTLPFAGSVPLAWLSARARAAVATRSSTRSRSGSLPRPRKPGPCSRRLRRRQACRV